MLLLDSLSLESIDVQHFVYFRLAQFFLILPKIGFVSCTERCIEQGEEELFCLHCILLDVIFISLWVMAS